MKYSKMRASLLSWERHIIEWLAVDTDEKLVVELKKLQRDIGKVHGFLHNRVREEMLTEFGFKPEDANETTDQEI